MLIKKGEERFKGRNLHPSIYEKYRITKELIPERIDPCEFQNRGGIDLETFNALRERRKDQDSRVENKKEELIQEYGSIKVAPISVGPCQKIESVIGTKNALVLLTEFKDRKHTLKPQFFQDLLFAKGSGKSLRDYYLEASWNQLDITGKVSDQWYSASGNMADYNTKLPVNKHYPRNQKLVKEAILQAKSDDKIDFSKFSKNGKIELMIVVFAGYGMDTQLDINFIRPHMDRLEEPIEVQKGIWADKYCLISELPQDDIGGFCHEVGHILGLPDFYKEEYSAIIGGWCLMGCGSWNDKGRTPAHPNAWCKVHLGWNEPEIIDKPPEVHQIPAVIDDDGKIYKVEVQGSKGQEYFLLENRQQKGFDRSLPGSGLLIWHVDEDSCKQIQPNSDPEHFFLTLEQSDGQNELQRDRTVLAKELGVREKAEKEQTGDEGDAYPGITINRNFDENSTPNSNSYDGTKSLVNVTSISDSDDLMEAIIGVQKQATTPASTSQDEPHKSKTNQLTIKNFMSLLASPDNLTPYQEGYQAGKWDTISKLKKEQGLDLYIKGYRQGYLQGIKKAIQKKALKK